ncbi:MAG: hypothetical protein L0Y76_00745, partial [Ignavibacteria bacterium]|nr:hypothetical protein [Ignavibacteria bacterium]
MKIKIIIFLFLLSAAGLHAQVELLEREHSVYEFLKQMDVKGVIDDFNSAKIPLSRYEVAKHLSAISAKVSASKSLLNKNDIARLNDYLIEFEFDIRQLLIIPPQRTQKTSNYQLSTTNEQLSANPNEIGTQRTRNEQLKNDREKTGNSELVIGNSGKNPLSGGVDAEGRRGGLNDSGLAPQNRERFPTKTFGNDKNGKWYNKPHYIYAYKDSNATFFLNIDANMYQRNMWGDSLKGTKFNGGDIGVQFRGTLFNRLGYALRYTNGRVFAGNKTDKQYVLYNDPSFRSSTNLWNDGTWFDKYEGYVRFESPEKWVALMFGKQSISEGFGYINKLYVSNFSNPLPFLKLDFKYKAIEYSFLYGNINTDSFGVNLAPNKMISMHRLDV